MKKKISLWIDRVKKKCIFCGWNNFIFHIFQTKAIKNLKWVYEETSENSKTANKMKA